MERSNGCLSLLLLAQMFLHRLGEASEDLFAVFRVVVRRDAGEAYVLLLPQVLVEGLSLSVEAHHQLVDHRANDGAQERCQSGHQEPAISSSGTLNKEN